jgi:hypothetical protein
MPRIARLETFHDEFVYFVHISAEDGAFGWGRSSTYNADITAQVFHRRSHGDLPRGAIALVCGPIRKVPNPCYSGCFVLRR